MPCVEQEEFRSPSLLERCVIFVFSDFLLFYVFYFFSERVVLVHMSDLERQHNSFTLCRPHLKALCETAIQGRFRASENLAIAMEIVSKRGELISFFFSLTPDLPLDQEESRWWSVIRSMAK